MHGPLVPHGLLHAHVAVGESLGQRLQSGA